MHSSEALSARSSRWVAGCWSRIVLGMVAVGLPGLGPAWAAGEASPSGTPSPPATTADAGGAVPKLRCDETTYEFPEVWSGKEVKHDYVIHNDGKAPLELLKVRASCGCTVAKHDQVIAPGQDGRVAVTLRTRGMRTKVTKKVTVTTNDPQKQQLVLTITGSVKARISIDPVMGANFGRITADSELTRTVTITNRTSTPMKLEPVPLPPGQKSIYTAEMKEIEPGKVVELKVTAHKPFKQGGNYSQLIYKTGIEGEDQIRIRCNLYSPPPIEITPSLPPVSVPLTRPYNRTIQIKYNGTGAMEIKSVEPGHEKVQVELAEQEPGRVFNLRVRVPSGFDPRSDEKMDILVKTNLESRPTITIPLRVVRRRRPPPREAQPAIAAESLIGKPAPVARIGSGAGKPVEIGPGAGEVTVLNFWASWSPTSRRLLPVLQRISNLYSRKGVNFLNISMDRLRPPPETAESLKQMDVSMPIALDPRHTASALYGVKGPPTLFLIGMGGVVEAVHKGPGRSVEELQAYDSRLRAELNVLLAGRTRQDFPSGAAAAGQIDAMDRTTPSASRNLSAPRLMLESLRQDTGLHKPGIPVSYKVYCRNDGMRSLTLTSVDAAEGLTVDPGFARILQPGILTALSCGFTVPKQPGEFAHRLTISTNDPARPKLEVTLIGAARPYIELDPPTGIDFGRNPRTHSMGRMATLTYHGQGAINYLSAKSSSTKFKATVKKILQGPNAMVTVNTVEPPFEIGEHNAVITVESDCKEQPTIDVPVTLYQPPRIEITPAEVTAPKIRRLQRRTVSIRNNGMESLNILGVDKSNRRIRTQFYPEPDGFSYKLELTFPANFICAPQGEKVTVRTDDEESSEIVIPIRPGSPNE